MFIEESELFNNISECLLTIRCSHCGSPGIPEMFYVSVCFIAHKCWLHHLGRWAVSEQASPVNLPLLQLGRKSCTKILGSSAC